MGISYPASVDTFPVPTLPEDTSLSSAGTANRAHTDHHRDLGLGITAVMTSAALKTHLHAGTVGDPTGKLLQANTHQSPDTDASTTALHHTVGPGANQAAAGNHTHDYNGPSILNKPFLLCTSSTRPVSPYAGLHIFETDTSRLRVWATIAPAVSPSWRLMPGSPNLPIVRLRQNVVQQLAASGTIVEWDEKIEDSFGNAWSSGAKTNVVIPETGLYQIESGLQWDSGRVPDVGHLILCINGVETNIRKQQALRGNTFVPSFSQTLAVEGKLRFVAGDILTVKVKHVSPSGFIGFLLSFIDGPEKIKSRLDLVYVGC